MVFLKKKFEDDLKKSDDDEKDINYPVNKELKKVTLQVPHYCETIDVFEPLNSWTIFVSQEGVATCPKDLQRECD